MVRVLADFVLLRYGEHRVPASLTAHGPTCRGTRLWTCWAAAAWGWSTVGTPGYMAPEQAEGRKADIGPATDVYALGVILYELLTGRPPFQGASTLETLEQVCRLEPVPPRRLQPRVPRNLETICLKCLNKEPWRRYASAAELAEDLRRFQVGEPILARPASPWERTVKWAWRRPAVAALLVLSVLVTLVGFPSVTWLWLQSEQERQAKEKQQLRADHEAQKSLRQAYRGSLAAALASFNNYDVSDAAQYLQAAPPALRGWEWRQLSSRLDDSQAVVRLPEAEVIALCPPGSGIVTAGNHQVRHWDALTGACLGTLTDDCSNRLAALPTAKGPLLLVQSRDQTQWRLYTSPLAMGSPGRVLAAALGRAAATFTADAEATRIAVTWFDLPAEPFFTLFELGEGNRRLDFKGHESGIYGLAFSSDGTRIASGSQDGAVGIWDTATGKNLAFLHGHTQCVNTLMFSPDGSRLLTGSYDGTVRQWDTHTGRPLDVRRGHKDRVYTVAYSPDGQWIASGSLDRTVRLWKTTEESEPAVLVGHTGHVQQVAFSQDGRRLASVGDDRMARVWEVVPREAVYCLRGHADWINPVAYSPDGTLLASGGGDKTVRMWDAVTGETLAVLPHPEWVSSLAFSPDGTWLVAGEWQGNLCIWDTATAQLEATWISKGQSGIVKSVAVSPDGTRIVAVYDRWGAPVPTPQVWDRKTGRVVGVLQGHPDGVLGVAYRPDGKQLATAGRDRTVRLWNAQTYEPSAVWRGHTVELNSVAYSADGRLLVSTSNDKTLRLWDVATGDCRAVLRGHTDDVFAAVFHPDGTRIASTGRDRFLRFWDVATGEEVARFPGHTSWIFSLAFSPDGTTLVSGSGDATVRLWDTTPLARRLQARQQALALRPEAERIVARLFEDLQEPSRVVQALRAEPQLSDALRREAFKVVLGRSRKESR
jgi:WD40 repeat protein